MVHESKYVVHAAVGRFARAVASWQILPVLWEKTTTDWQNKLSKVLVNCWVTVLYYIWVAGNFPWFVFLLYLQRKLLYRNSCKFKEIPVTTTATISLLKYIFIAEVQLEGLEHRGSIDITIRIHQSYTIDNHGVGPTHHSCLKVWRSFDCNISDSITFTA